LIEETAALNVSVEGLVGMTGRYPIEGIIFLSLLSLTMKDNER
jgi:hypothetical protein